MVCPQCGTEIPSGLQLCPQCGTAFSTNAAAGSTPPRAATGGDLPLAPHTDGKAIASLILGLLSFILSVLTGIPAIVLGHTSLSEIRRSNGRLRGRGMAFAGLAAGYVSLVLFVLILAAIIIPNVARARMDANQSAAAVTMRVLIQAQATYAANYPESGFAAGLATLGPGPDGSCTRPTAAHACLLDKEYKVLGSSVCTPGIWCTKDAYRFTLVPVGSPATDYILTATPLTENSGRRSYCATASAIIRSIYGDPLSAPPTTVQECESWSQI